MMRFKNKWMNECTNLAVATQRMTSCPLLLSGHRSTGTHYQKPNLLPTFYKRNYGETFSHDSSAGAVMLSMTTETCGPGHLGWFPSSPLSFWRSSFACTLGVLLFHLGWLLLTFLLLLPVWYWEKMRTGWGSLRQKLNSSKAVHWRGTDLVKVLIKM